jgi:hypothetical protein
MGAEALREGAADLEHVLQARADGHQSDLLIQLVQSHLEALVSALRATPGVIEQTLHTKVELSLTQRADLQQVVQTLQHLLEQDDSEAQALWEAHAAGLHALLPQAELLEVAIGRFDFEEALKLLARPA